MTAVKVRVFRSRPGSLRHFIAPAKWTAHLLGPDIDDNEFRHFDTWAEAMQHATGTTTEVTPVAVEHHGRKPYVRVTDEMRARMVALLRSGQSIAEVAAVFDVSGQSVRNHVKRAGGVS